MSEPKRIIEKTFDEERALYHLQNAEVIECAFAGAADGESALKESRNVTVRESTFALRYPLWHAEGFRLVDSKMEETCRAPLWYASDGVIDSCILNGVKALRECDRVEICNTAIRSPEFGWKCRDISLSSTVLESEYSFLMAKRIRADYFSMKAKYAFQYVEDVTIENATLETKDAFWNSRNVTVRNSEIKGEYLGWYSENLTIEHCKITGTQPLCYCKGLKLIDCELIGADRAFEYSEVEADLRGSVLSVKNPKSGFIRADSVGEVILSDSVIETSCEILTRM